MMVPNTPASTPHAPTGLEEVDVSSGAGGVVVVCDSWLLVILTIVKVVVVKVVKVVVLKVNVVAVAEVVVVKVVVLKVVVVTVVLVKVVVVKVVKVVLVEIVLVDVVAGIANSTVSKELPPPTPPATMTFPLVPAIGISTIPK
jgi:hypothetical protein